MALSNLDETQHRQVGHVFPKLQHDEVWCNITTCSRNFNTMKFGAILKRVPVTLTRRSLVQYYNVFT